MTVCTFTGKTLCMSSERYDVSTKLRSESNNKFKRLLLKEKKDF